MRDNETAVQRLSRHLGLGKYGDKLAQEILDQYAAELAEMVREWEGCLGEGIEPLEAARLIDPASDL